MDNQDSEIAEAEMSQLATGFEGRVEVINSDYIIIKDTYNSDEGKTNISSSVIKAMKYIIIMRSRNMLNMYCP